MQFDLFTCVFEIYQIFDQSRTNNLDNNVKYVKKKDEIWSPEVRIFGYTDS